MFNEHFFCHDPDGWGPLRPNATDPDLALCFTEGIFIMPINILMIIFGSLEFYHLIKKSAVFPNNGLRNWHYLLERIALSFLIIFSIVILMLTLKDNEWKIADLFVISAFVNVIAMIFTMLLQKAAYTHSHSASSVLLLYWLFYIVIETIKLRSWLKKDYIDTFPLRYYTFLFSILLALFVFVLELLPKPKAEYELIEDDPKTSPEEGANIFSRLTFYWMTPLMKLGHEKYLVLSDLWNLNAEDRSKKISADFEAAWKNQLSKKNPSLLKALIVSFGGPFAFAAFFKASQDLLNFVQPQLLKQLILFVSRQDDVDKPSALWGYCIAAMMFLTAVFQTMFLHQYFHLCAVTGMRARAGLVSLIYKKALLLSNSSRQGATIGEIVNYMSVDAQKIVDLTMYLHIAWSGPLQIVLALYFLYQTMGASAFAGVAVMILMLPLNAIFATLMRKLQKEQMKNKDERIKFINELLNGIKVIKLYAWESAFLKRILEVRNNRELVTLKKLGYLAAMQSFTWSATPFLVSFATFAVYVTIANQLLTAEIVFVALALFNLLQFPLSVFPTVLASIVEASVAISRVSKFLKSEELDPNAITREQYISSDPKTGNKNGIELVSVKNGTFKWSRDSLIPTLNDVNFSVKKGELVAIVGKVGSGKSSLLSALLGEMEKISGDVTIRGYTAYAPQSAWIMNATLRDNITFGLPYDPKFYDEVIEACSLKPDIEILPGGDLTEIGEKGINLSGGQKARISLARAVYARADVYLFDDPLSAVDAHVGKHIFDNVIGPNGLLRSKARVFVTNGIHFLSHTSSLIMLRDGNIVEQGHYDKLMKEKKELYSLIMEYGQDNQEYSGEDVEEVQSPTTIETYEIDEVNIDSETAHSPRERRFSVRSLNRRSSQLTAQINANLNKPEIERGKDALILNEDTIKGKVSWKVYVAYMSSCSFVSVIFYLFMLILSQSAQIGMNVFLKYWSSQEDNSHVMLYLMIYCAIGLTYALMTIGQTIALWVFCAIRAARILHEQMLNSVIRSPMSFFDTTPLGRILNRFSKDQYTIDEVLPRTFSGYFRTFFIVLATITVISFSTPPFIFVIIPLLFIYNYIQSYYLSTSRELKRLDSLTRSPIYSHFQETLGGVSTIRAYQQIQRFIAQNEFRLDENQKAYYPSVSCNRWLAVRLELIGSLVIFSASLLAVISAVTTHNIDAGLVGLSLSYALSVTQALNWAVRQFCEIETNIVSVERVKEYIDLPSEAPLVIADNRPQPAWPQNGVIEYKDYSTRYRPGLELVLRGVSFHVKPKEKIGIVGRTGAGKSSLTLSLFRLIESAGGSIIVDGMDISKIGLYDLRSRITIIPQDPILFEGTVLFNLDPFKTHNDVEIWQALQSAHLKDYIAQLDDKLHAKVLEGGDNFSQGQRQLICLARALLRRSPIIVLDEATAAVDVETDAKIQKTIRTEFNWATLLCIAHRLRTIIDYDRVLVLDRGKVAEFDTPYNLLQDKNSVFRHLCEESNEFDYLMDIASKQNENK
ncbi:ATP-binding cassette transporter 1 [Gigaspora rosea]|uniref:ATP-binding cassette transporter 1 n=1 Tax=Gigaspora rosea TaxID=44941 RepID=A0A397UQN8_9GLOM|nr:ATP-binding cassette transporter 1 [Gigaspora rosea]